MSIHSPKFVPEVIIEKSICIGFASGGVPKLFSRKVPKLSFEGDLPLRNQIHSYVMNALGLIVLGEFFKVCTPAGEKFRTGGNALWIPIALRTRGLVKESCVI